MTNPSISPEGQRALQDGAVLRKKLARAAAIGRANGLGYEVFGALTFLFAMAGPDWIHLAQGALVVAVGHFQRKEAPRLERGLPEAARAMSRNELYLMFGLAIYCLARLLILTPETTGRPLDPRLAQASGIDLEGLTKSIHTVLYSTLLIVAVLYQGGLALYFRRRVPLAEQYQREVPEWARETLGSL
ncbi:MAG: hypothetical protein ACJA2W_002303 [Planctomycetota bacterium]